MNEQTPASGADLSLASNSPAVAAHLTIMQSVVQRMGGNSASCKAWCVTLVSAILVLVADKGKPEFAWIAIMPIALFLALDAYYLALEREFRTSYNQFIAKLHANSVRPDDVFVVAPKGRIACDTFTSVWSFSVWPFYGMLLAMTVGVMIILHPPAVAPAPVFAPSQSSLAIPSTGTTTTTVTTTTTSTSTVSSPVQAAPPASATPPPPAATSAQPTQTKP